MLDEPHESLSNLLTRLHALEVELHHPGVRCSADRLAQLLHPEFHEVGRSGLAYDRDTVINFLAGQSTHAVVEANDFAVALLAPGCALLTYRSAHVRGDGGRTRHTRRSSLWLHTAGGWQLRYHQGTPTDEDTP